MTYRLVLLDGATRLVQDKDVTKDGDNLKLENCVFEPHCEGVWFLSTSKHAYVSEDALLVLLEVPTVEVETARVVVEPVVTAGTDRGGEDLDFHYRLDLGESHHRVGPNTVLEPVWSSDSNADFFAPGDGLNDVDFETDEEFYTARLKWWSGHYEFEWTGTPEEALQLASKNYQKDGTPVETVEQRLRELGSRKPHVEVVHFVDGNAE